MIRKLDPSNAVPSMKIKKEKSILIIDDEKDLCMTIKDHFEDEGFEVYTANSAEQGCDFVGRKHPTIVLLDICLPDFNGLDFLAAIKKVWPNVIVFIVTGVHDTGLARRAMELGAFDYITKPFSMQRLQTKWIDPIFN